MADQQALAAEGARVVVSAARSAVAARGRFGVVLSGGSTPRLLYALLASDQQRTLIDWSVTQVFFGDERCVPPDHEASNYRMAREALLDHVPLPERAVHRISGESGPEQAASLYAKEIRRWGDRDPPRFDLVLLGMGTDGHTASLFPGAETLGCRDRWVVPAVAPAEPRARVTVTLPLLNAAREVMFLVAGRDKAAAFARVMHQVRSRKAWDELASGQTVHISPARTGAVPPGARPVAGLGGVARSQDATREQVAPLPASLIAPEDGRLIWFVEQAAANLFQEREP